MKRIDGGRLWLRLSPVEQQLIGVVALELAATWIGLDAEQLAPGWDERSQTPRERALVAADNKLMEMLQDIAAQLLRDAGVEPGAIPSVVGQVCARCGCTEEDACTAHVGPCRWVGDDLCSACSPIALPPPAAEAAGDVP